MTDRPTEDSETITALQDLVDLYQQLDADSPNISQPLSGADLVEALGFWMERNRTLLQNLGILDDGSPPEE